MEIFLVRHPEPEIEKGICYGSSDIPLKPGYALQLDTFCEIIAPYVQAGRIARLFSSDLQRCRIPAEIIAERFSLALTVTPLLQELDMGQWELYRYDELWKNSPEYVQWCDAWQTARTPDGESLQVLRKRVLDFLAVYRADGSLCVTHAGVIRVMKTLVFGSSLDSVFSEAFDYLRLVAITHQS